MLDYCVELIADKRADADRRHAFGRRPRVVARGRAGGTHRRRVVRVFSLLFAAGSETTRHAISGGVLALVERPDQLRALRSDPGALPTAIEEMLRWTSPSPSKRRTATKPTVLGGHDIQPGEKVLFWEASANRDEKVFERPMSFDIARDPNPHLALGRGVALLPRRQPCPARDARRVRGVARPLRRHRARRRHRVDPQQPALGYPPPACRSSGRDYKGIDAFRHRLRHVGAERRRSKRSPSSGATSGRNDVLVEDRVRRYLPLRHPHRPRRVGRRRSIRSCPATRSPAPSKRSAREVTSTRSVIASVSASWSTRAASVRTASPATSSTASKDSSRRTTRSAATAAPPTAATPPTSWSTSTSCSPSPKASASTSPRRCCAPASRCTRRCVTGARAPASKVAIVGLGGLGHLGREARPRDGRRGHCAVAVAGQGGRRSNGWAPITTTRPATRPPSTSCGARFDLIVNTVSVPLPIDDYLSLLRLDGALVMVGLPPEPLSVTAGALLDNRRSFAGSSIGGMRETQESARLFCASTASARTSRWSAPPRLIRVGPRRRQRRALPVRDRHGHAVATSRSRFAACESDSQAAAATADRIVQQAVEAEADGFTSLWYASAVFGDPLVAMALAGRATTSDRTRHVGAADLHLPPGAAGQPRRVDRGGDGPRRAHARRRPVARAGDRGRVRPVVRRRRRPHRGVRAGARPRCCAARACSHQGEHFPVNIPAVARCRSR